MTLGNGNRVGDVWWEPASTFLVQHGHVGMYTSATQITHNLTSGIYIQGTSRKVDKGARKMTVEATSSIRSKAKTWIVGKANDSRVNRKYNWNFAAKPAIEQTSYNCSQLVWAAFRHGGVNLNDNGGGVYPKDIRDSARTKTYKTL